MQGQATTSEVRKLAIKEVPVMLNYCASRAKSSAKDGEGVRDLQYIRDDDDMGVVRARLRGCGVKASVRTNRGLGEEAVILVGSRS